MQPTIFIPGYGNSGPEHWQTIWEQCTPGSTRIDVGDWLNPAAGFWIERLSKCISARIEKCILVAHSLGCLLVAKYIKNFGGNGVAGTFLVAPPDPRGPSFPSAIRGFEEVDLIPLLVPSIVISSTNDPYSLPGFGVQCAEFWGAEHYSIADAGHINAASGYGVWEPGRKMLTDFSSRLKSAVQKRPNKTDAGNGSYDICRVSDVSRSPSPDPGR